MRLHTPHTLSTVSTVMTLPKVFIPWFLDNDGIYYSCWRGFTLLQPRSPEAEMSWLCCACCLLLHAPRSAVHSCSNHAEMT